MQLIYMVTIISAHSAIHLSSGLNDEPNLNVLYATVARH